MGSLGGSSSTKPDKQTMAIIKELMAYGKEVGKIPYQPYRGLDVAAFTPQQQAGMQSFADMGNAFGMGMPEDVMAGIPEPTTGAGGVQGYESYGEFARSLAANKGTPAAKRYSEFYDLPVDSLYDPNAPYNPGSGGKGSSGGTGGTGSSGGSAYFPSTGNKALPGIVSSTINKGYK